VLPRCGELGSHGSVYVTPVSTAIRTLNVSENESTVQGWDGHYPERKSKSWRAALTRRAFCEGFLQRRMAKQTEVVDGNSAGVPEQGLRFLSLWTRHCGSPMESVAETVASVMHQRWLPVWVRVVAITGRQFSGTFSPAESGT
jgi:hypothetical protein